MATSRRLASTLAAWLLGASLAGCSSSPAPAAGSSGGSLLSAATAAGGTAAAATTAPRGSGGSTVGGGGGHPSDVCGLFSAADVSTLLGKTATQVGPTAGEAHSCSWGSDDFTTIYLYWTDPSECDETKASLSGPAPVAGADFAGASSLLGASFAGVVAGGTCYIVEVSPTERSPRADVLGQILQQFVQRAGA